jgi:NAD(P)-dependent dehydrogenase (short-subunit alcohol dehydrogenase family)
VSTPDRREPVGGAIINTGSYSALRGIGPLGQVAHAAAKGGVIAMTRSLAVEGARHDVRANSISPGFVSTPSTDAAVDDTGRSWQVNNHLIQRPGKASTSRTWPCTSLPTSRPGSPARTSASMAARRRAGVTTSRVTASLPCTPDRPRHHEVTAHPLVVELGEEVTAMSG